MTPVPSFSPLSLSDATQTRYTAPMKSAVLPQVRVEPELRADLESVLEKGETLSEFVEKSVRGAVEYRRAQQEFLARGEAAWQRFERTGQAHTTEQVSAALRKKTEARRRQLSR